ncbi:PREDICTED: uncharacterized protein LOC106818680 [Priapulus caudatus]|uniref:Uncharacterized protein LOC106818680 n=1 Tax=Priapulus caudatus TaxID=37621 RepID=A0ABM1F327_PRICU|nr:PREDICTED: uncharacterized protein LOC106818680 [Priapulus caudatus]
MCIICDSSASWFSKTTSIAASTGEPSSWVSSICGDVSISWTHELSHALVTTFPPSVTSIAAFALFYVPIFRITQNEKALDKFFLVAPELSNILHEFATECGIDNDDKRTQHHEITGGKLTRMTRNAGKLTKVFREHGDPFMSTEDEDEIYNMLTKEVMTAKVSKDIIERDEIGQHMFEEFVTERLTEGRLPVWAKMKRRKIGTYKRANAAMEVTEGRKVVTNACNSLCVQDMDTSPQLE